MPDDRLPLLRCMLLPGRLVVRRAWPLALLLLLQLLCRVLQLRARLPLLRLLLDTTVLLVVLQVGRPLLRLGLDERGASLLQGQRGCAALPPLLRWRQVLLWLLRACRPLLGLRLDGREGAQLLALLLLALLLLALLLLARAAAGLLLDSVHSCHGRRRPIRRRLCRLLPLEQSWAALRLLLPCSHAGLPQRLLLPHLQHPHRRVLSPLRRRAVQRTLHATPRRLLWRRRGRRLPCRSHGCCHGCRDGRCLCRISRCLLLLLALRWPRRVGLRGGQEEGRRGLTCVPSLFSRGLIQG